MVVKWNKQIKGCDCTPDQWLEENYSLLDDAALAAQLVAMGVKDATLHAVHKRRNAKGWIKNAMPNSTAEKLEVDDSEGPNEKAAWSTSTRIKTPDDLAAVANVDESVWKRVAVEARKYDMPYKSETKKLKFNDARLDGIIQSQTSIQTMYYVKVRWIRKEPVAVMPALQAIKSEPFLPPPPRSAATQADLNLCAILADAHIGFRHNPEQLLVPMHDRSALSAAVCIINSYQPHIIVLAGDWNDNTMMTDKFLQDPAHQATLQAAILEEHYWLKRIRQICPESQIMMLAGNHETRMRTALIKHFGTRYNLKRANDIEGWPVMSFPHLLGLEELHIEWVDTYPGGCVWLNDHMKVEHGEFYSATPGGSARAALQRLDVSTIFGHGHRSEHAAKTLHLRNSRVIVEAHMVGCLCHIDGRVPGQTSVPNWQQGIGIASIGEGVPQVTHINIHDGQTNYPGVQGKMDHAKVVLDALRKDHPGYGWGKD